MNTHQHAPTYLCQTIHDGRADEAARLGCSANRARVRCHCASGHNVARSLYGGRTSGLGRCLFQAHRSPGPSKRAKHCSSWSCANVGCCKLASRAARVLGSPRSAASGHVQVERPGAVEAVVRYGARGAQLHIDTRKLGRIVRPSHRATGNRRDAVDGSGRKTLFVAIDDPARLAFTAMHADEKQAQAVLFLRNAVATPAWASPYSGC